MKAYDSVEMEFMLHGLLVGVSSKFVSWVKECITTPKFSISFDGSLVITLKVERGLGKEILCLLTFLS
jgi:hypothetical protein